MSPGQARRRLAYLLAEADELEKEGNLIDAAAYRSSGASLESLGPRLRDCWGPGTITQKVQHDEQG